MSEGGGPYTSPALARGRRGVGDGLAEAWRGQERFAEEHFSEAAIREGSSGLSDIDMVMYSRGRPDEELLQRTESAVSAEARDDSRALSATERTVRSLRWAGRVGEHEEEAAQTAEKGAGEAQRTATPQETQTFRPQRNVAPKKFNIATMEPDDVWGVNSTVLDSATNASPSRVPKLDGWVAEKLAAVHHAHEDRHKPTVPEHRAPGQREQGTRAT